MPDSDVVRRGYDRLASRYAERSTATDRDHAVLSTFLDSLSAPARVLDAGCGNGEPVLDRLADVATERAVGLDVSRSQVELADEAVPAVSIVQGDLRHLPFPDGSFDAVVAVDAIIHVPLPDHEAVVAEFARVLRPGGRLLLSEGARELERTATDWLDAGVEMRWHMAGPAATREHLHTAGFEVVEEWEPPEPDPETGPQPPYFAARLPR